MNNYLADTHILLWWLSNDKKLSKKIKEVIEDPNNNIQISSVSIWEIIIKKSLNKLTVPENLKDVLLENNFNFLPITVDHAMYVEHLPLIHNDPFDRLLISQCIIEDLMFITLDSNIYKYKNYSLKVF